MLAMLPGSDPEEEAGKAAAALSCMSLSCKLLQILRAHSHQLRLGHMTILE